MIRSLDEFTRAYIECALWSSTDDNDKPLDSGDYEISDETRDRMIADCKDFQEKYGELISEEARTYSSQWSAEALAGHDFWLTRNRHGAGFWDGDWQEPAATQLTDAAHKYGECNLYVGDDGKVYV